jgi:hypothetical protein
LRPGDQRGRDGYDRGRPAELRPLPAGELPSAPWPAGPQAAGPQAAGPQARVPRPASPADLRPLPAGPADYRARPDERLRPAAPDVAAGRREATAADRNSHGPGPIERLVQAAAPRDEDAEMTRPLPVILPGANSVPRPGHIEAPRGPFEAARPSSPPVQRIADPPPRSASITGSVEPPPATFSVADPGPRPGMIPAPVPLPGQAPAPHPIPEAAAAKLDQIKDLYLTAEAIGEDALDRHFDQVSERQRELIREFFDRSGPPAGHP